MSKAERASGGARTTHRERKTICVGGLILQDSANPGPDAAFLESIAEALHDREARSSVG